MRSCVCWTASSSDSPGPRTFTASTRSPAGPYSDCSRASSGSSRVKQGRHHVAKNATTRARLGRPASGPTKTEGLCSSVLSRPSATDKAGRANPTNGAPTAKPSWPIERDATVPPSRAEGAGEPADAALGALSGVRFGDGARTPAAPQPRATQQVKARPLDPAARLARMHSAVGQGRVIFSRGGEAERWAGTARNVGARSDERKPPPRPWGGRQPTTR